MLYVHPSSGEVVEAIVGNEIPIQGLPRAWAYGIHVGGIGGLTTQVIALIVCICLIGLGVSGIVMWLLRRPRRGTGVPRRARKHVPWPVWVIVVAMALCMPAFGLSVIIVLALERVCRVLMYFRRPKSTQVLRG